MNKLYISYSRASRLSKSLRSVALATILVKNVSEDLLRELKRLKVELGCGTWAELLAKLVDRVKAF